MNLMRNESTNGPLLASEKQMKILLASKSCVETYDKISDKPIAESVILVRKAAESLEKKTFFLVYV